jgi:two-component system phosphate regulon sensor histidine kinase PhoR
MTTVFGEPLFYIYFIYGISFLTMAGLIFRGMRSATSLALVSSFSMLAAFGLTHGIAELTDWVRFIGQKLGLPENTGLLYTSQIFLILSFVLLLQFGVNILTYKSERKGFVRAVPSLLVVVFLVVVYFFRISDIRQVGLISRYSFGFAGSALSAIMLFRLSNAMKPLGNKNMDRGLAAAAAGFTVYAICGGLIVTPLFGLPIQLFRAVCAFVIAVASASILEIFKVEH